MATESKREVTGAIIRGLLRAISKRGLEEQVRAAASPGAQATMRNPPLHLSWVPADHYEELLAIAGKAVPGGERQLGHDLVAEGVGPILRPLLKTVMNLAGGGPAGLLKGLSRAVPMQYRGLAFEFLEEGPRAGTLAIAYSGPVDPVAFKIWQGCLEFGTEIHGVPTKTELTEVSADHQRARIHVSW